MFLPWPVHEPRAGSGIRRRDRGRQVIEGGAGGLQPLDFFTGPNPHAERPAYRRSVKQMTLNNDVEAVERRLSRDLVLPAGKGEAVVREVLDRDLDERRRPRIGVIEEEKKAASVRGRAARLVSSSIR